jgi:hypothetical protein
VVIDHGRDPKTGKRKQIWHSGFATLSDAVEARTRLLRERDTGSAIDPSRQTFAEYLRDEWLPSREPVTGRAGRGHGGIGMTDDAGLDSREPAARVRCYFSGDHEPRTVRSRHVDMAAWSWSQGS